MRKEIKKQTIRKRRLQHQNAAALFQTESEQEPSLRNRLQASKPPNLRKALTTDILFPSANLHFRKNKSYCRKCSKFAAITPIFMAEQCMNFGRH